MKFPLCRSTRFQKKAGSRSGFKIAALLALFATPSARAATYTYDGTTGTFSADFTPSIGSDASNTTAADTFNFGGTTYTATNDLTATLNGTALKFTNTGLVTLARGGAGSDNTISFGGNTPTITLSNTSGASAVVTNALDLIFYNSTTITGAGNMVSTGVISGNSALIKGGSGTVTLSGANIYTGGTTINSAGGTLQVRSNTALGTGDVNLAGGTGTAGGTLQLANDITLTGPQVINVGSRRAPDTLGPVTIDNLSGNNTLMATITVTVAGGSGPNIRSQAGTLTLAGDVTNTVGSNRPVTLYGNGNGIVSGALAAGTGVTKQGSGTWTLTNAANSFTSGVEVDNGVLSVNSISNGGVASALGQSPAAAVNINLLGGTLQYTGDVASTDRLFTIGVRGGTLNASGTGVLNFAVAGANVSSDSTNNLNYILTSGSKTIQSSSSAIAPAGNARNLLVGQTVSSTHIPVGTTITAINYDTGLITLSNAATAASTGEALTFNQNVARTLTLTGTNTGANTLTSTLADSAGGGVLSVAKTGAGTWVLGGANSYSGTTTVNGGALVISGISTAAAMGAVNVTAGTLLGSGTAPSGLLTVAAGANLAPGSATVTGTTASAPGVLTVGTLTLATGANFNVLLNDNSATGGGNGTLYSQLVAAGVTGIDGSNLNLTLGNTLLVNDKFFILLNSGAGTTPGTFGNVTGTTFVSGGKTFQINYADNGDSGAVGNDISLTVVVAVPEPRAWIMVLLGLGVAGLAMRRRASN